MHFVYFVCVRPAGASNLVGGLEVLRWRAVQEGPQSSQPGLVGLRTFYLVKLRLVLLSGDAATLDMTFGTSQGAVAGADRAPASLLAGAIAKVGR